MQVRVDAITSQTRNAIVYPEVACAALTVIIWITPRTTKMEIVDEVCHSADLRLSFMAAPILHALTAQCVGSVQAAPDGDGRQFEAMCAAFSVFRP